MTVAPSTAPAFTTDRPPFIPGEILEIAAQSIGAFFEPICKVDRLANARDFLELSKSFKRAKILGRYTRLESRKLLEIGSGLGTNLAVWIKQFGSDGYGAEPGGAGFNQGYVASQRLLAANGIDPRRIVDCANVLEHTENPEQVLREALGVLRPGGVLHMEMPNFLSYFEGHYMVVAPPVLWKPMLACWVKLIFGRDPAFARTLQTRINPGWRRRQARELRRKPVCLRNANGEEPHRAPHRPAAKGKSRQLYRTPPDRDTGTISHLPDDPQEKRIRKASS
jgi:SAM-dependent methyltransferase